MDYFDDDELTDSNENPEETSSKKEFKSSIYKDSQDKTSSKLSSIKFGKQKLTRAEKRFIRYKKAFNKGYQYKNKLCFFE
jgi:hypothetical protein